MKSIKILMIAVITIFSVAAFSQTKATSKTQQTTNIAAVCCCLMHPAECSNKADICNGCDMDMAKEKTCACPMHPEECSSTKGKCSKCNMDMREIKATKTKKS